MPFFFNYANYVLRAELCNSAAVHNSGRPVYDLLSGCRDLFLALVAFKLMFMYLFASP